MGNALYPHSQWGELADVWERMYPLTGLPDEQTRVFRMLEQHARQFVDVLLRFQPAVLAGRTLTGTWKNQALVLVNHGGATGAEVYNFSSQIIDSVYTKFGVLLQREVNIIN